MFNLSLSLYIYIYMDIYIYIFIYSSKYTDASCLDARMYGCRSPHLQARRRAGAQERRPAQFI